VTRFGLLAILGSLWYILISLSLALTFCVLPKIISYKGRFHSNQIELWAKNYGTFSVEFNSNCPSILIRVPCGIIYFVTTSHVLPYSSNLNLSSLHLVSFRHPYHTHMKSNSKNLSAMNSTRHFLHIYHSDFPLDDIFFLQTLRRLYGVTSFSNTPL
jgi:hypothetical protein